MASSEWSALLAWLGNLPGTEIAHLAWHDVPGAGRGLVAIQDVQPNTRLLRIPAEALLNLRTIQAHACLPAPLLPAKAPAVRTRKTSRGSGSAATQARSLRLSSKQGMTLFLAMHRPSLRPSKPARPDTPWNAYLPTLPRDFAPWHPLTWDRRAARQAALLERLPIGAGKALAVVRRSWAKDLDLLGRALRDDTAWTAWAAEGGDAQQTRTEWVAWWRSRPPDVIEDDLLWAWLNVHTRSLYIPLGLPALSADPSDPTSEPEQNDHTLCPALDLLNHAAAPDGTAPCLVQYAQAATPSDGKAAGPSRKAHDFLLVSPPDRALRKGEAVTFEYGMRGDDDLFADYGFVPRGTGNELGNRYAEVDVTWWLKEKWAGLEDRDSELKRQILEEHGYWGNYTLHPFPSPAHPSHRPFPALRLLRLDLGPDSDCALRPFLDTLIGVKETISAANEAAVRTSLSEMCRDVQDRSRRAIADLQALPKQQEAGDWDDAVEMVCELWRIEAEVARRVDESVADGVDF